MFLSIFKLIILSIFLNGCSHATNNEKTDLLYFTTTPLLGLWQFTLASANIPHQSRELGSLIKNSKWDTPQTRQALSQFAKDLNAISRRIKLDGYPSSRRNSVNLIEAITLQCALAKDLKDFSARITNLMTAQEQASLIANLDFLKPAFNDLVWSKWDKDSKAAVKIYTKLSHEWDVSQKFLQARTFYGSQWPLGTPFTVGIYPLPEKVKSSTATSLNGFQSVGIIPGEKDHLGRMSVIFHEIAHSLYDSQSAKLQHLIDQTFTASKSPYAVIAYEYFNEIMATSVGNGWFYDQIKKELDHSSWYNDSIIDPVAKAIYPLVKEYISKNKEIDHLFIESYIKQFAATLPKSKDTATFLSQYLYFINILDSSDDWANHYSSFFNTRSMYYSSSLEEKILKESGNVAVWLLADSKKIKNLEKMIKRIDPKAKYSWSKKPEGNAIYRVTSYTRPIIVMFLDEPKTPWKKSWNSQGLFESNHWYQF